MDTARSPMRRRLTDYFTKLLSTAEPQHFPACLRRYEPVDITRRPSRPVRRPRRCTEITSKQASGSSEQASGSGGKTSGSEESGDPKLTPGLIAVDGHHMTVVGVSRAMNRSSTRGSHTARYK